MAAHGVMLDTDVVVDFLRGQGEGVTVVRELLTQGTARVSSITAFELSAGTRTDAEEAAVREFCRPRTLSFSRMAAETAGRVARTLRAAGTPIGPADTLIAGLCLHHDLQLATGNRRHFSRVSGLRLHESFS